MHNAHLLPATLFMALSACATSAQGFYKCTDDKGHTTYSDKPCAPPPTPARQSAALPATAPTPASKSAPTPAPTPAASANAKADPAPALPATAPAAAAPEVVTGGKSFTRLTVGAVEDVLRLSMELGQKLDHKAQCALYAPDMVFKQTSTSNTAAFQSGGRSEICALAQLNAQTLPALGMRMSYRFGKIDVRIQPDGKQATARYDTTWTMTMPQGVIPPMNMACKHDEVLGLYSGSILFKRSNVDCRPLV